MSGAGCWQGTSHPKREQCQQASMKRSYASQTSQAELQSHYSGPIIRGSTVVLVIPKKARSRPI